MRSRWRAGLCLAFLALVLALTPALRMLWLLPSDVTQFQGEQHPLEIALPWGLGIDDSYGILELAGEVGNGYRLNLQETGSYDLTVNLLGLIPLKRMRVTVIPSLELGVGGHSIGVKLAHHGVIVAGLDAVQTSSGTVEPAREAGFMAGDIILAVDGRELKGLDHAAALLEELSQTGRPLEFQVVREGNMLSLSITPVHCRQTNKKRLGLLLRDTSAGVGTLTFWHPETGIYGALGHMITDGSGARPVDLSLGRIVDAEVISIQPGAKGSPGEKKGAFVREDLPLGTIRSNTDLGIYGTLSRPPEQQQMLPIGLRHQVKPGAASIATVVQGDNIELFDIEIEQVFVQNRPTGKGLIIKITDPRLLERTGGIVQGMSGSPIIQDGRIVGAITHVFINDPQRGYGCFIEWMVMESGLLEEIESTVPPLYLEAFFWINLVRTEGISNFASKLLNIKSGKGMGLG